MSKPNPKPTLKPDKPAAHKASTKPWHRELDFEVDVEPLAPSDGFMRVCEEFGLAYEEAELKQLGKFLAILMKANEQVNLTAIKDVEEAWVKHIFDALTLLALMGEMEPGMTVCDVGSGGGLPALPLAICLPKVDFTLVEATGKKAGFLMAAAGGLGLGNVRVISERAETLGRDVDHRACYDVVTARAVGPVPVIAELCVPFAAAGGRVLLIKGQRAGEEIESARRALHMLHAVHETTVDTPTGKLVVLDKRRDTPKAYPRRPGEPKKAPL